MLKDIGYKIILYSFLISSYLLLIPSLSNGTEIIGPDVRIKNNEIYVTTSLSLDANFLEELKGGIGKELTFYIDIFKKWNIWPDEFIYGKSFIRNLKCDPVKMEYIASSREESVLIKKRFKSFESMMRWALSINDLKLININELEPGEYFVKVTVESKKRELPPVLKILPIIIFLSDYEFKIAKDSSIFQIGTVR